MKVLVLTLEGPSTTTLRTDSPPPTVIFPATRCMAELAPNTRASPGRTVVV